MKDELYKKVYIKTEDDLPEKVGNYPVHQKGFEPDYVMSMYYNGLPNNFWVQAYDWYLLPIEQGKTAMEQVREVFNPIQIEDYPVSAFDPDKFNTNCPYKNKGNKYTSCSHINNSINSGICSDENHCPVYKAKEHSEKLEEKAYLKWCPKCKGTVNHLKGKCLTCGLTTLDQLVDEFTPNFGSEQQPNEEAEQFFERLRIADILPSMATHKKRIFIGQLQSYAQKSRREELMKFLIYRENLKSRIPTINKKEKFIDNYLNQKP